MPSQRTRMNATKRADALFSKIVRSRGVCEARWDWTDFPCAGNLQCCHIISRRYRAIRWAEDNARCMCAAHHIYYTHRPLEWELANEDRWDDLRARALHAPPEKAVAAVERLKALADV